MKRVNLAVVGLGSIARTHITALRSLPAVRALEAEPALHTLVTRRPADVAEEARAMGFARVTASLEEALADPEVHAVDICTPNALHRAAVEAAVAHQKAIYCEKPLASRLTDSAAMAESVRAAGVVDQVALTYRYHPAVIRTKALLDRQAIGDLLQLRVTYNHSGYLNANVAKGWRSQADLSGGGALLDLGVHAIDLVQLLVGTLWLHHGESRTLVRNRPVLTGGPTIQVAVDDWALVHVETESGVPGVIEVSRVALGAECFRIELYGTNGSIIADLARDKEPALHTFRPVGPAETEPALEVLQLLPPARLTMGTFVDAHQAGLCHFLLRVAGTDPVPDWAPTFAASLAAERIVFQALAGLR